MLVFMIVLHQDITEAYDQVEAVLNLPGVDRVRDLRAELETAKNALFRARMLTDPEADS